MGVKPDNQTQTNGVFTPEQDNDKTTTRQMLNLCISIMPFTPDMSDQHVCLSDHVAKRESMRFNSFHTSHGNFQELFPSGYLSFSAFKASAGPHCVLVVDPGSRMITADYYTKSTALTDRPTQ